MTFDSISQPKFVFGLTAMRALWDSKQSKIKVSELFGGVKSAKEI